MRCSKLSDPTFFSAQNSGLIREFKATVVNWRSPPWAATTSEFAYWKPKPDSPEPEHPQVREVTGEPKARYYAVTVEAVRNLSEVPRSHWLDLRATASGWAPTHQQAPQRRAFFVAETLGDRLPYFQIGNEADLFDRHLRDPKTWSAKTYLEEWLSCPALSQLGCLQQSSRCLMSRATWSWLTAIADQWPSIQGPPHVTTLTHHYYFGGPATNPEVNIPNLLKPATMEKVQNTANIATAAASKSLRRVRNDRRQHLLSRRQARVSPTSLLLRFGQPTIRCCWQQ